MDKSTSDIGRERNPPMSCLLHRCSCYWVGILLLSMVCTAEQFESTTQSEPGIANLDVRSNHRASKDYGVDVSWPMQHDIDNQQYENFMDGCYKQRFTNYEKRVDGLYQLKEKKDMGKKEISKENYIACNNAEQDRLEMNLNQPKEMQNYTHAGYAKVQTPSIVFDLLKKFWEKNIYHTWPEFWNDGNTYVNHWEAPTMLLDIGRQDLPLSFTTQEYNTIIQSIQDVLESWTNQRLVLTSAYGIRVYGEGAILAPHVDRLPLVSSAIINIFQLNVTEPWVLEVIGHDGMAHNLTSKPRDMILYESASVIHGRPYPLKGNGAMYGSLFVHFEPLYHTFRHARTAGNHYSDTTVKDRNLDNKNAFEKALEEQLRKPTLGELLSIAEGGTIDRDSKASVGDADTSISRPMGFRRCPDYVWPDYYTLYDQRFYFEYNDDVYPKIFKKVYGNTNSHLAASSGELNALKEIAETQGRSELFKADKNGWKPIHEAARSGHADTVEYLLKEGAKVNERTNSGDGGTALYWAQKDPKKNAKAVEVLKKYGGVSVAPFDKNAEKNKSSDTIKDVKETEKKPVHEKEKEI